ncbi:glyoxalase [Aneurinibacillus migulanus]|uniref:Glyoxalase/fosfomycin resistance/dioxygenase domain-containing protein n=1 Tax=Aneurinibacillus migulanus TaxID=47500 RepID=A0A1G8V735_ANEMI|nr:glyoxalase [Aneurinibacillus migulanus]MED1618108.1 glyoxalase [Aneurinibacillus migulanus]GED15591.1 hypothetical protein AMI01nite_35820 [Aneurinibacillus migulanus]SDJ61145.1 hypothetical protein SAMN04487909_12240 [Aneurinibacillus migulanus]
MGIKLDMVGIVVKDMKKSLDFYRVLGLVIPESANEEQHVEVEQSGFRLAFDSQEIAKEVYGSWEEPTGHRIELAFSCESYDSLNELYAKIIHSGYDDTVNHGMLFGDSATQLSKTPMATSLVFLFKGVNQSH